MNSCLTPVLLSATTPSIKDTFLSYLSENVTTVIALAAIVSPVLVAIINNLFNCYFRHKEYVHIENLKRIETESNLIQKRLDVEFISKREAIEKMFSSISSYLANKDDISLYQEVCATAYYASSMCSNMDTRHMINWLVTVLKKYPDRIDEELEHLSDWIAQELYPPEQTKDRQNKK